MVNKNVEKVYQHFKCIFIEVVLKNVIKIAKATLAPKPPDND